MRTEELTGNGPPLLMLHGWGQSHKALMPLAELLTPNTQPFLVDLPGFGESKPPSGIWSSYDYADSLVRYMDSKDVERFSILGHSFGGKVALSIALRYPEKVDKLILIGSSGVRTKRSFAKKVRLKGIVTLGRFVKLWDRLFDTRHFLDKFAPRYGSRDYQNAGPMRPILVKSVNEDFSPVLKNIRCPTLILWGEDDSETPLSSGLTMAELIKSSRFHAFPHHGHELFKDTGAHLSATYIRRFLA